MGIYYSDKIRNALVPTVTKSTTRYKTKIRLTNVEGSTKVRFMRNRDITFNEDDTMVHIVETNEAYRPDIIAYKYYGNEIYSWVILAANNLYLPYQLKPGLRLVIPSLQSLQGSRGKLVTR